MNLLYLTLNILAVDEHVISRVAMKQAYRTAGCCPKFINYNKCAIVYPQDGPSTGFTCREIREFFCITDSGPIDISECPLCYGVQTDPDCAEPAPISSARRLSNDLHKEELEEMNEIQQEKDDTVRIDDTQAIRTEKIRRELESDSDDFDLNESDIRAPPDTYSGDENDVEIKVPVKVFDEDESIYDSDSPKVEEENEISSNDDIQGHGSKDYGEWKAEDFEGNVHTLKIQNNEIKYDNNHLYPPDDEKWIFSPLHQNIMFAYSINDDNYLFDEMNHHKEVLGDIGNFRIAIVFEKKRDYFQRKLCIVDIDKPENFPNSLKHTFLQLRRPLVDYNSNKKMSGFCQQSFKLSNFV